LLEPRQEKHATANATYFVQLANFEDGLEASIDKNLKHPAGKLFRQRRKKKASQRALLAVLKIMNDIILGLRLARMVPSLKGTIVLIGAMGSD
jgi:hypothetical protein